MMTMPAGWYPAPHADNELRYWNGATWGAKRPRKQTSRRRAALFTVGALLIGLLIGGGVASVASAASAATLDSQITELEAQRVAHVTAADEAAGERSELAGKLATAKNEVARLKSTVRELEAQVSDQSAKLRTQAAELKSQKTKLKKQQAELDARQSELDARQTRITELEAAATPAAPVAVPPAVEAPPANVYFKNCSAARAAGASPVHAGDPGYGPHLDRDGDGVGCE